MTDSDTPSVESDNEDSSQKKRTLPFWKLVTFSRKIKITVIKLCILFALDSFASSLAPLFVSVFYMRVYISQLIVSQFLDHILLP